MSEGSLDFGAAVEKAEGTPAPTELESEVHSDVLEIFHELKTVVGVLMIDQAGYIVRSNLDPASSGMYCNVSKQILDTVRTKFEERGVQTKLNMIQINSCVQELLIVPNVVFYILAVADDKNSVLVIVQNPSDQQQVNVDPEEKIKIQLEQLL